MAKARLHILAVAVLVSGLVVAGTTQKMSFEEVARDADVVVLGIVLESPEMGALDASGKHVLRQHKVSVDRYLKGDGRGSIMVVTLGGQVEVDIPGQPSVQEIAYLGHPQLPEVGTHVLLFLKSFGSQPETYQIYSATHGVVLVETRENGTGWVGLAFKDPRVMPSGSRADYDRAKSAGYDGRGQVFGDIISTGDLDLLMQIALNEREAAAANRIQSFRPTDKP